MSARRGHRVLTASNYEHLEDELRWLDLLIVCGSDTSTLRNRGCSGGAGPRTVYITPARSRLAARPQR